MIKIDWNIFKEKFSANPQDGFEWMCYLLFCNEYGTRTGIFRYKNQSAIETDPIIVEGNCIGWQAKFYESALSNHKNDILETIIKAKRDYPDLSKLVFYTNSEWGQNKGQEPQGKKDVEDKAKEKDLKIEWRCRSYFDSPFVVDDCKRVASHFFLRSDNIFELLNSLESHTKSLLEDIETSIIFGEKTVSIDRSNIISDIDKLENNALIISGEGGTGKTALIKELYEMKKQNDAFYVHKATEFSVNNLSEFLSGVFLNDFIEAHDGADNKIVVIDSAENLLTLKNTDNIKEYLSKLIENGWRIWFTTRNNYLDDLIFQLYEMYKINFNSVHLTRLSEDALYKISIDNDFLLPDDKKLKNILQIPFYLREYLKSYQENKSASYSEFKESLWPRVITRRSPQREQYFIRIAEQRANSGAFYIVPDVSYSNPEAENALVSDGILSYEPARGYFITHDIYEEWALEKFIDLTFISSSNPECFFNSIKMSLPVRRVFRSWLSEKLSTEDNEVVNLIIETLSSDSISKIWKDEVVISMLLSDFSDYFFSSNKNILLENELGLIKRICLLIRIGCKEIDHSFFQKLGVKTPDILSMEYVITKPKGNGWKALIKFVNDNVGDIGVENLQFVLPVVHDWNSNNKSGETTKHSSLITLKFYRWCISNDVYLREDDFSKNIVQTILYGVAEIKNELEGIINDMVSNKWKNHNDPYQLLSEHILTKMDCFIVATQMPEKVMELAKCFWSYEPSDDDGYYGSRIEIDHEFGVESGHQKYYPASSYQTPIYALLQTNLECTLDFVIDLLNNSTSKYVESNLDRGQVEKAILYLDDGREVEQPISNRLWCMYRGTQVNTDLLESILMSLERFFLERGENTDSETLEFYLNYILSRSKSSALTAVVASIVCAFHDKTFNIAKVLFRTKEFFFYDTSRMMFDQTHKFQLTSLRNFSLNRMNEHHENERISSCDKKHRQFSLENIALHYQFFRTKQVSEKESENRLHAIWDILDSHYNNLPKKEQEDHQDKTWRLYLARMDKRKMSPETKEVEGGIAIDFNPEIDPDLKEYSEKSLQESSKPFQHSSLKIWADGRLYEREGYKKYENYENEPLLALNEAKEIWVKLRDKNIVEDVPFDRATPSYVCAVLLRDFKVKLDKENLEFCKDVIFEYVRFLNSDDYQYQISDGLVPALFVLPKLIEDFPEEKPSIRYLLIRALMRHDPITMMGVDRVCSVAIQATQFLWGDEYEFMKSLYIGYMAVAQKHQDIFDELRQEAYKRHKYDVDRNDFAKKFTLEVEHILNSIDNQSDTESAIACIGDIDNDILITAFQLAALNSDNQKSVPFVEEIIKIISSQLLSNDREDRIDYTYRHEFLQSYASFILRLDNSEKDIYLEYFTSNFSFSEGISDLLKEFVSLEDSLNTPDSFWYVWHKFRDCIVTEVKNNRRQYDKDRVIESFLFSNIPWKEDAKKWHTFSPENRDFFRSLSDEIGGEPSFVYCISKLLCGIGSEYLDDGIYWLSNAIKKFDIDLSKDKSGNIVFYLERYMRRFLFKNRDKVRRTQSLKDHSMVILDFLVEQYSITGYLLREDIA